MSNRSKRFAFVTSMVALLATACRQEMYDQSKYEPYEYSSFFEDLSSARPIPPGAISQSQYADELSDELSLTPISNYRSSADFMWRGKQRYEIYCSPCHAYTGDGKGMIVLRGYAQVPSFHDQRLKNMTVGHLYNVIVFGIGAMPSYRAQVQHPDRLAIAAYIKALQFSQAAQLQSLPPKDRLELRELK